MPALNLPLSRDRIAHISVWFEIHKPGYGISFRETRQLLFFVLSNAALKVVGDSDIEDARRACQ